LKNEKYGVALYVRPYMKSVDYPRHLVHHTLSTRASRHLLHHTLSTKASRNPRWRNMPDEAEISAKFIAVIQRYF